MGIFDDLKNKISDYSNAKNQQDDQFYDDEYDEGFDQGYDNSYDDNQGSYVSEPTYRDFNSVPNADSYGDSGLGMLRQTPRGEAQSVSVYSRSGVRLDNTNPDQYVDRYSASPSAIGYAAPHGEPVSSYRPGAYDTPSSYEAKRSAEVTSVAPAAMVTDFSSATSAQLPAYILKTESYDDVETVVRRVKTRQPVALVFANVKTEVAMRVLDFSYGFACGSGASVEELGDRLFMVLPRGCEVKESDLNKLREEGYLKR